MKRSFTLALSLSLFSCVYAFSQTWNGSVSSDWNTATNWTPNTVPGSGSAVTINNAAAVYQPALAGNINVISLTMSQGILNLNGFTLTCSGNASFTGDSLYNGKVVAVNFLQVSNMHMGGKIVFDKTGSGNNFWDGGNKLFGDSLIIIWRSGTLHLESSASAPDSIFGNFKVRLADNYSVQFSETSLLYVQENLILDNAGNGTFTWQNSNGNTVIGSSLLGENFSSATPNFLPVNITTLSDNDNGPFYSHNASVNNCVFNGGLTIVVDSNVTMNIHNSSLLGADNLFQAGNLDVQNSKFGKSGIGTTILRVALNQASGEFMRDGNNKFLGDVQWETYAAYPGNVTMQQTFYGADSCFGSVNYILKGNSALTTNGNGNSYVAEDVIIDGQGAAKTIQFTGGGGVSYNVGGNFTIKNFTPFSIPGAGATYVYLRNLNVAGTDAVGTIYCYAGDLKSSSFNGNFKLIADSSQAFIINNSFLYGTDNLFQAGNMEIQNCSFGQTGIGTTILRAARNQASGVYMRDGNNKFLGNVQWEPYAVYPGNVTIQQTFYGTDSCWGNMSFILKGNSALTTNGGGHSYVAGNVIIDGQGARKTVQFIGGGGISYNVSGNFTVKNFTPFSEPGAGTTNVLLNNLYVSGTDTVGTFYCHNATISNSSFNGNFKLIADSSQANNISNSYLLGANNLFQAGNLEINNNKFGQASAGTTILRMAHSSAGYIRDGNNKFFGDANFEIYSAAIGLGLQQTFYGPDSCLGNLTVDVSGPASANLGGNNIYIGKGLTLINNGTGAIVHNTGGSAIRFIGTDTANYSYSGSGSAPSILNIEMNRRGGLKLMSPLTYTGTLLFTRGIIQSSSANPLQIPNGAFVSSAWDSSYVDGPARKTGNTAFIFPLGKNNIYAPISITAPALTTDAFAAQYFNHLANNDGYDSTQKDASLNHLSRKEYWVLDRNAGTSSAKVTLSWKTLRSGFVTSMSDLRVAHWNGSMWKDEGNGSTIGSNTEGTIQSLNTLGTFSPFTLSSISTSNPLPVRYISFDVKLNDNKTVSLLWKTADEINIDYFEIERSKNGNDWISLTSIDPQSSHEYFYTDMFPEDGLNFYRIKETDIDGKYFLSDIKFIQIGKATQFSIWPNPARDNLYVQIPFTGGTVEITDISGRLIGKYVNINPILVIPVKKLTAGIYILKIESDKGKIVQKFIKE